MNSKIAELLRNQADDAYKTGYDAVSKMFHLAEDLDIDTFQLSLELVSNAALLHTKFCYDVLNVRTNEELNDFMQSIIKNGKESVVTEFGESKNG